MKKIYFYFAAVVSMSILSGCKEPTAKVIGAEKEPTEILASTKILEPTEKGVSESEINNMTFLEEELEETTASVNTTVKVDVLLTEAPEISLKDVLSSTMNQFQVQPGSYSWNYKEGNEVIGLVACGSHPLDANRKKSNKLTMPKYNRIDYVPYTISCIIAPDRLIVREWDVSSLGDTEAVENSQVVYENEFIINLKPNMVYEITAQWDKENLEVNGFYGEGNYGFLTE